MRNLHFRQASEITGIVEISQEQAIGQDFCRKESTLLHGSKHEQRSRALRRRRSRSRPNITPWAGTTGPLPDPTDTFAVPFLGQLVFPRHERTQGL
jgi:hypothetical protein